MSSKRTVFIVGAGASSEIGLPLGGALKGIIGNKLNIKLGDHREGIKSGDLSIVLALRELERQRTERRSSNINHYIIAGRHLYQGVSQAPSIDYFLRSNADDEAIQICGKLGILVSILEAERKSSLYVDYRKEVDPKPNMIELEDAWFSEFYKVFFGGLTEREFANKIQSVTFIVFNYDRCIEQYMYFAVRAAYNVDQTEATELLKQLQIIHPYGKVGDLPWENSADHITYGLDIHEQKLIELIPRIKTFNEEIKNDSMREQIKDALEYADDLIFLGFGFHEQNMDFFRSIENIQVKNIYATVHGESAPNCEVYQREMVDLFTQPGNRIKPHMFKNTCVNLFKEYRRVMS